MTFNYIAAKRKIFELARAQQFYDPISLRPLSKKFQEEELSAILVMRSQLNRVDWRQVKLWDIEAQSLQNPDKNARARMSDETVGGLFRGRICVANEFPLMTTKLEEVQIWGDMRADVVLYESDRVIVLIESKFGAPFTGRGKHLEDGQLARQAKYLDSLGHIPDKYLMLVSGYEFFDSYWNSSDLFRLKEHRMKEHRKKRKGPTKSSSSFSYGSRSFPPNGVPRPWHDMGNDTDCRTISPSSSHQLEDELWRSHPDGQWIRRGITSSWPKYGPFA